MNFNRFFNLVSYAVVSSGALSLFVTGGIGLASAALFVLCAVLAWRQEEGGRQMSERMGTFLVVAAVPLSYFGWKAGFFNSGPNDSALAGLLGQLILVLSIIKLLQKKTDRDWVFLYLMGFFEVLLSAGITISPLYLLSLIVFLLTVVCAIVAFEIKTSSLKAGRDVLAGRFAPLGKLPAASVVIAALILCVAAPMFFLLPRVGGAGLLGSADGLATRTGFTDSVRLGEIGRIQQSDQVVMRVRVEADAVVGDAPLKWRGVALDLFDNRNWRSSRPYTDPPYTKLDRDFFLLNFASGKTTLVSQTFYLEPLDTPVLFALPRPVAVSGAFELVFKNSDDNLKFPRRSFERVSYKVGSDPYVPPAEKLRADRAAYPSASARFLQLPDDLDPRIAALARDVVEKAGAKSRYDKAVAIERYLKESFGYTLEMKAGGDQPVADFLFNVREGHCEYFASAMALMLRTQGVATRVVNGFQQGEYNDTADVFVVRQRDAHSWVEVSFPGENVWATFDPTPSSGRPTAARGGILGGVTKYLEALETFWIQYFVSYDNQEQRSLFRSMRNGLSEYQSRLSETSASMQDRLSEMWSRLKGERGIVSALEAAGIIAAIVLSMVAGWLAIRKFGPVLADAPALRWLRRLFGKDDRGSIVEFYGRMLRILERDGSVRKPAQTPLEFADSVGIPEAVKITSKYHSVRFGAATLSREDRNDIELWLRAMEGGRRNA